MFFFAGINMAHHFAIAVGFPPETPPFICRRIFKLFRTTYVLRSDSSTTFAVPRTKKQSGDRAFSVAGPRLWNEFPLSIRGSTTLSGFKSQIKSYLFPFRFFPLPFSTVPCIHRKRRYINLIIIIIIYKMNDFDRDY